MNFNVKNYTIGIALIDILQKMYVTEEGYKRAANTVKEKKLKQFLLDKSESRRFFNQEIKNEISRLDQDLDANRSLKKLVHKVWVEFRKLLYATKAKTNLEEVVSVDRATLETYNVVLLNNTVSQHLNTLLFGQRNQIKKDIETFSKLKRFS